MTTSIRLGRIAGIDVGVNWSWFIVVVLITASLAAGVFPDQNPGLAGATYWVMAVVAALAFFGSLLLHELGHALQARRDRVEIDGITLWLFGGVARFKGMYETPGAEFRIAIAGPAVTVVIAATLLALGALVELPAAVDGVVTWLGYINVVLLVFNLLPALPLDGGRLLHAALWRARDLGSATRTAAGIGVAFGWLLIGGGFALLLTAPGLSGLWLAVLGWFLMGAARAEAAQIATRQALEGVRVGDLMARAPVTVAPDVTLGRFVDEVVRASRFTTYPVVEDGRPVGLLSFRCVAEVPREQWEERRVAECMIARDRVPALDEAQDAADALADLATSDVRRALVVDGDRLVGLLSVTDLARAIEVRGPEAPRARTAR